MTQLQYASSAPAPRRSRTTPSRLVGETRAGEQIYHALGDLRVRTLEFIARGEQGQGHYTATGGGSAGLLYALLRGDRIVGGVGINVPASPRAERDLITEGRAWQLKRLYTSDSSQTIESNLLWCCYRDFATLRGEAIFLTALADPLARDERNDQPLSGRLYVAAGMFPIGFTRPARYVYFDGEAMRHARQGKVTVGPNNMPDGWVRKRVPDHIDSRKRIFAVTIFPDTFVTQSGARRRPWSAWRRREWRRIWGLLPDHRKVAAVQWINAKGWESLEADKRVLAIGEARKVNGDQELRPAYWPGELLELGAGPVWVPMPTQEWLDLDSTERTGGRVHLTRTL